MGAPMAANLLKANHDVAVWNRTAAAAAPLEALGGRLAATPAEAAEGADVVITMLLNEAVVETVLFSEAVLGAIPSGALVIDMSSIPPPAARRHHARLAERGVRHLDAPVSGGTSGAAKGSLAIMVGGNAADFTEAETIFVPMGRPSLVGSSGTGQIAKLTNQVIVSLTIAAVAEGLMLASAAGADISAVHEAIQGGFADSRILREHGRRIIERNFTPGGPVDDQIKDLDTILATAADYGIELPVSRQIRQMYLNVRQMGCGGLDHSALILALEQMNPGREVRLLVDQ
jgi:2-hydroxy-3-oxopropionate reductase